MTPEDIMSDPGTVTTEYHDRLILQAQAEINTRGNRIAELEAEVAALRLEVEARPFNGDASLRQQVVDRAVREALTKAARAVRSLIPEGDTK
jgi:hypothetical protein